MRVFVTGASGFIGSRIVQELLGNGHRVVGLTRSDKGARALAAAGAEVQRGDVEDAQSLRAGVSTADGVIHTAFNHDFSQFVANCESDRRVIETLGALLAGSTRPLVVTSAIAVVKAGAGEPAVETDPAVSSRVVPRAASEEAVAAVAARGVNVSVVRLSQVHDPVRQGLVSDLIALARAKGVAAYAAEGQQRWPAAHIGDVARLYRLALEHGVPGAVHHAVAEEGVSLREMAEAIARGLRTSVASLAADQVEPHFGWLTKFATLDMPASSAKTQALLGWRPAGPTLLADLAQMRYRDPAD
ncbi:MULTISPECIES: SDR family oxidoreductase [unclassified Variovorax]|uniref:SDR family oxidoreductase n=1 Tax=unclassified Variovorax TaxID=663243 RepID=UPI0025762AC5|nr:MULTISPECIES: SDR family oxidoreductase [unclassified Variovorax]MDM0089194.1 SDR family oxidoreductase [Variovorax sp. J22G40]MDM0147267.1 SDR family oxidoreductase [Variovorax sp. J2P1-31]